jgi:hypothetical protein
MGSVSLTARLGLSGRNKTGRHPYSDLCFMKEKERVGADIYIEDSPTNLKRLRVRKCRAICFANCTNRDIDEPRARTWDEVYDHIKRMEADPELRHQRK